jgi:thioredoxin
MPIFDTPITANEQSWQKVSRQPLPLLLYLFNRTDAQLDDALKRTAREYAGQILVARVNAEENPQVYAQYNRPTLPALITVKEGATQSVAAPAQATDIAPHTAYLLGKGPKPAAPTARTGPSSAAPTTVTDSSFQKEVLQSNLPVLVDFWAPWCGPCRMVSPIVEQLAKKYAGRVKVAKLNVDDNPRTASQYQTTSIPTLILFKQNREVARLVGAHPEATIERMITSAF